MKILMFVDYYLPGYKSGGPVRTISNIVERLGNQLDFWIVTRDRDMGEEIAYKGVLVDFWNKLGLSKVYYASPRNLSVRYIWNLIDEVKPDVIYLNSFFSVLTIKVLLLRRLSYLSNIPLILAPRGEFSAGALKLKETKKRLYINLVRRIGLYRDIIWHGSSNLEKQDIIRLMGDECHLHIAPDMPPLRELNECFSTQKVNKISGKVRLVFLSRISAKKNLQYVLKILAQLHGEIALDIYGPIEDKVYWQECLDIIKHLPNNVHVSYKGSIPHTEVNKTLHQYHFFVLPTLGENFGHAILEALVAGCPVIISDQTPWLTLTEVQAGWALALDQPSLWADTLQKAIAMNEKSYANWSQSARQFALEWMGSPTLEDKNLTLFTQALKL